MNDDPRPQGIYTDADTDTERPVHPLSGAEQLARADKDGERSGETEGTQEPPD